MSLAHMAAKAVADVAAAAAAKIEHPAKERRITMSATYYDPALSSRQRMYLEALSEALRNVGLNVDFSSKSGQTFVRALQDSGTGEEIDPHMEAMIRRASWLV